jgi:hypothetical protein
MLRVDGPQTLPQNMCVDLSGGNIGMPQHRLHCAQIGASLQQVGSKGMAEHVWFDPRPYSSLLAIGGQDLPESLSTEFSSESV